MIKVGKYDKKEVSELNNELFLAAENIMEKHAGKGNSLPHIGWFEVGVFIDWLEDNYEIIKKAAD